jgi:hypothetical protein
MYAGVINLTHIYIQVKSSRLEEKGKKKKKHIQMQKSPAQKNVDNSCKF